jgi:2-keto-4-pentenoate hydratase/2-oxohepta-3-ene-1,7-dioic acid hydratase in catechol pathway
MGVLPNMTTWLRFTYLSHPTPTLGTLEGDSIAVHTGDLFTNPQPTGECIALKDVTLLTPCVPNKMVALWNNFRALAAKLNQSIPPNPLYFLKANSNFHPHGAPIRVPASYDGKVVYEGELGVVIGKTCRNVSEADASSHIFGYT